MQKIKDSTQLNKILVLCLAGIGDTLMFTPTLRVLRQALPKAQIDALVMHAGSGNLLDSSPDVNRVICWNFVQKGLKKSLMFCRKLRQNNYDVSLTAYPSNRCQYNVVSKLIGAKVRIGHQYNVKCSYGTDWLAFHHRVNESKENKLHNVLENLRFLEYLLIDPARYAPHDLRLYLSHDDKMSAENFLRRYDNTKASLRIGIHPGSGETKKLHKKRWDINKFAQLADSLIRSKNAQVLVFGGNEEKKLRHELQQGMTQKPILVENVSFRQTAALIGACDVFISADTGLMHAAAAVGTPTVALFGPTNPNLTFPWGVPHQIVSRDLACRPCYVYSNMNLSCPAKRDFECMKSISVTDVMNRVETLLREQ